MEASNAAAVVPYTWPTIAILNDASSGVSDADGQAWTEAIAHQVLNDFGPRWHNGGHFEYVPIGKKAPADAWVVALLDTSDQAGALGYHDLTPAGLPLGKVFAGTDRQYGGSISITLSHEVLEMLGDPWINLTAQADDGKFYAWEASDAVEDDSLGYPAPNGVMVSAFVTPAWFGHGAEPVSYPQGRVTKAFELAPGGYISVFDPSSGQGWQQVTAQRAPASTEEPQAAQFAAEQIHAIPRVGSRRERRFRGRGQWVVSTFDVG
jgi:hypothetical protein